MALEPQTSSPVYTHTLREFLLAGQTRVKFTYQDFCYTEKIGNIVFVVKNALRDYLPEIKEMCMRVALSVEEQRRYRYNRKILAFDLYNSTDLYFIILILNNMVDVKEFNHIDTLLLPLKKDLPEILTKINISEGMYISKYNNDHN